jgi:Glutathione S-transferase, N-terminal domain
MEVMFLQVKIWGFNSVDDNLCNDMNSASMIWTNLLSNSLDPCGVVTELNNISQSSISRLTNILIHSTYKTEQMAGIDAEYTLYSSPFSLYSMMARHTIQLGPTTHGAKPPKNITLTLINHRKNLNLKEDYLKINPKGQVPSMTGNVLEQPLTSSHAISLYLAENHYPAMLPAEHEAVIRDLLERLHAVPGPSFSNKNPTPEMTKHNPSPVEEILKRTDISPEYRAALEAKLN